MRKPARARLGDIDIGETITMAPLVVRGKVPVGNSGGEYGVRGWIVALDADDGNLVWRAYSTGPDAEVLIGERFQRTGCSGKPPALDEAIERGHRYESKRLGHASPV